MSDTITTLVSTATTEDQQAKLKQALSVDPSVTDYFYIIWGI